MNETTTTQTKETTAAHKADADGAATVEARTNSYGRTSAEERKMIYHLVGHIDDNGRYNDALKPIALAYGAGAGLTEIEAKKSIDAKFQLEIGKDMKGYLEQHRLDRGMTNDGGRKR